ncbi:MAG: hypothetical protein ACREWG_15990 [Gammaproteobacteria bacterium]
MTARAEIAVDVVSLFVALLSSRATGTPGLPAQGGQRRSSYFNNEGEHPRHRLSQSR